MSTELEQRKAHFLEQLNGDRAWDTEESVSPYLPEHALEQLVELGEEAVPFLCELCRSPKREWKGERGFGVRGLELLGPRAGAQGLAALEAIVGADNDGLQAAAAIERVDAERYWELKLYRHGASVAALTPKHRQAGTGPQWLARILALNELGPALAAVKAIDRARSDEHALIAELRKALMSPFELVRAAASWSLASVPNASPVEALIEGMATSGQFSPMASVAWHPDSVLLLEPYVRLKRRLRAMDIPSRQQQSLSELVALLQRRRWAGLVTPLESVSAFIAEVLRAPRLEWRHEEFEVTEAANCARELGAPALMGALVDAVTPRNTRHGFGALAEALRVFGPAAVSALEARKAGAEPEHEKVLASMLSAMKAAPRELEWPDADFVSGSIDDESPSCAFGRYAQVLRERPSAHAAFQLAWIDRAFGASILEARVAWIRSLGFRDEAFLGELATPVAPLEGGRGFWRRCAAKDVARCLAAGLPGLAFMGSGDEAHRAAAKAHVARVKAACMGETAS